MKLPSRTFFSSNDVKDTFGIFLRGCFYQKSAIKYHFPAIILYSFHVKSIWHKQYYIPRTRNNVEEKNFKGKQKIIMYLHCTFKNQHLAIQFFLNFFKTVFLLDRVVFGWGAKKKLEISLLVITFCRIISLIKIPNLLLVQLVAILQSILSVYITLQI